MYLKLLAIGLTLFDYVLATATMMQDLAVIELLAHLISDHSVVGRCIVARLGGDKMRSRPSSLYSSQPSIVLPTAAAHRAVMRSAEIGLRQFLLVCIVSVLLVRLASSKPTNRTIDDEYGDSVTGLIPLYQGNWNYGPRCSECCIHPDTLLVFDRTWHDTTTQTTDPVANFTLTFNGTAIWVYCIIPNFVDTVTITTYVNLSFELDGDYVQTFSHEPELNNASMAYNVTVYSNTSMDNREHTLIMTPQHAVNASVVLFDWAQYTYDPGPDAESGSSSTSSSSRVGSGSSRPMPSTSANKSTSSTITSSSSSTPVPVSSGTSDSSRTPVNAIAGGVGGGLGALVLGLLVLFLCHRRRGAAWVRKMTHGNSHGQGLDESGSAAKLGSTLDLSTTSKAASLHSSVTMLPGAITQSSVCRSPTTYFPTTHYPVASDLADAPSSMLSTTTRTPSAQSVLTASQAKPARQEKHTARYEESMRQIHDAAELQRQEMGPDSVAGDGPIFTSLHDAPSARAHVSPAELKRQIDALQMELDRLKVAEVNLSSPQNQKQESESER
ncbi:uncharacterized protein LAESUDRAFT_200320 [Laetiporus sulphureus 93-53]|uniref:Uncharacterized protein n=1 Tax=Laetiporus sulphureus 93-53 TaxID=1314785 RepID=A0A165E3A7_9APHY|nr:uncharacterized protein LAESUDRAFT_200320 [Laetiporus sulphureus 93-53]KZT06159.1 hypothetical protein LAESUDRAFT_200320 [Laetiporus sulphureus 93-53]